MWKITVKFSLCVTNGTNKHRNNAEKGTNEKKNCGKKQNEKHFIDVLN